jgi:hypothetical protein
MESSTYINKGFSHHDKEYDNIGEFNLDMYENLKNSATPTPESFISKGDNPKYAWEVEVNFVDKKGDQYGVKKIIPMRPNLGGCTSLSRKYTYYVVNKKTGDVFKTFNRTEITPHDIEDLKFYAGLYSLKFINNGKYGSIEARYGGIDGRLEEISLPEA